MCFQKLSAYLYHQFTKNVQKAEIWRYFEHIWTTSECE